MIELNRIYHGHCLDLFKGLDDESIDSVITSPPYWQLRDYKWDGQWGLEPTFQEYLEHLWQMMDEVWRVLKPMGTVWINLGDTYGTKSGNFSDQVNFGNYKHKIDYVGGISNYTKPDNLHKCLLLIPHRFAVGCIERGWIIRNDIVWAKRNAMPESVTDRLSKKHEYIFFITKEDKYYFDLDGIRDRNKTPVKQTKGTRKFSDMDEVEAKTYGSPRARKSNGKSVFGGKKGDGQDTEGIYSGKEWFPNDDGKNPGSVSDFWDITTKPSSDEHYAAYNDELIGKPIVAGSPKGGVILDPFCGTATTGCRALELGRNFIGFEGSEKFVKMGNKNLLPYLQQTKLF